MLNNVVIIGRLVQDPELRYTTSGTAWATFTLAVDRPYTDKTTGEREADFLDVSTWRKLAETSAQHLKKGGQAAVVGRIKTRTYEDKQGNRRKAWDIEADDVRFLQRPSGGGDVSSRAAEEIDTGDDAPF